MYILVKIENKKWDKLLGENKGKVEKVSIVHRLCHRRT